MLSLLTIFVLSYLCGSIPNSIIAGKLLKSIDIREHGSGNAGATNVFRILGWKAGVVVGLADIAKGFAASYYIGKLVLFGDIPYLNVEMVQILAGVCAVCGHIWTVFASFKGGKGVLTIAGMLLGLAPVTVLTSMAVFALVFWATRYVSLGSIVSGCSFGLIIWVRKFMFGHDIGTPLLVFSTLVGLTIVLTHHSNIKRLLNGTENRFKKS